MKTTHTSIFTFPIFLLGIFIIGIMPPAQAEVILQNEEQQQYSTYRGKVLGESGNPISSAFLSVDHTNVSTVTNEEGEFSLKIPTQMIEGTVTISNLGYKSKTLTLEYFKKENTLIELEETVEELTAVNIFTSEDPLSLVRTMLSKTGDNYSSEHNLMKAFYRESIKNRWRNVSLSEAVINIHKKPYSSPGRDNISIVKARKSADYNRLDTLALKLRGGPFNTLYSDIMKYPEYLFKPEELEQYSFNFDQPTRINERYLYVVNFEQNDKSLPWFFGKLYIDAQTTSLVKATYELNVDNRKVAGDMFVKRKPNGARVYPINVQYEVNYRESDGKWYYGYGSAELQFVVNWKRRLFNTRYTVNSEMAVTDWKTNPREKVKKDDTFISSTVVMADDVSGFTDVSFWGNNNIIEPEKSIQNAIEKIQRQLGRTN